MGAFCGGMFSNGKPRLSECEVVGFFLKRFVEISVVLDVVVERPLLLGDDSHPSLVYFILSGPICMREGQFLLFLGMEGTQGLSVMYEPFLGSFERFLGFGEGILLEHNVTFSTVEVFRTKIVFLGLYVKVCTLRSEECPLCIKWFSSLCTEPLQRSKLAPRFQYLGLHLCQFLLRGNDRHRTESSKRGPLHCERLTEYVDTLGNVHALLDGHSLISCPCLLKFA